MSRAVNRVDKVTEGEKEMRKLLISLLVTIGVLFANEEGGNYFVDNFLKYSTFYASVSLNSPFVAQSQWEVDVQNGTFVETTKENELAYNLSIGVRKLARFKYQSKGKNFYDGSEKNLSDVATIGNVSGWEYLVKYSTIRQFGEEFNLDNRDCESLGRITQERQLPNNRINIID